MALSVLAIEFAPPPWQKKEMIVNDGNGVKMSKNR